MNNKNFNIYWGHLHTRGSSLKTTIVVDHHEDVPRRFVALEVNADLTKETGVHFAAETTYELGRILAETGEQVNLTDPYTMPVRDEISYFGHLVEEGFVALHRVTPQELDEVRLGISEFRSIREHLVSKEIRGG